jgi:TPP-dependent pyruvate/acetoin dehydrogenase alpha subunit
VLRDEARAQVEDAITFARNSAIPDPADARRYVFA